jgi:transcriptional regulator with XRE-family HTH domain
MYMAHAKLKQLRWRPNCIRYWREHRGFTLERAAEALSESPFRLGYTHNSLGRVENGKQMPTIQLIEALAKMYDTDIDSLLNRRPGSAPDGSAKNLLEIWDGASVEDRGLILGVAKKVANRR